MATLSPTQRTFLKEATSTYHASLPGSPAEEYLESRGLFPSPRLREKFDKFRLGYVEDPLPGHDYYKGMISVPYLRRSEQRDEFGSRIWSTVSIRFRCIREGCLERDSDGKVIGENHVDHGKYNTTEGDRPRLFNTIALLDNDRRALICEGEMDAMTATVYGFDAVAVPGATAWQPHFGELFLGYETVYILADGDKAGRDSAKKIRKILTNGRIIHCPPGQDVNSWITTEDGYNEFKESVS